MRLAARLRLALGVLQVDDIEANHLFSALWAYRAASLAYDVEQQDQVVVLESLLRTGRRTPPRTPIFDAAGPLRPRR